MGIKGMLKITRAGFEHVGQIIELWKEFVRFHSQLDSFYIARRNGPAEFQEYIREKIGSNDSRVWVAMEGDEVVAYSSATIKHYPPVSEMDQYGAISELVVKAGYRRRGIGEALVGETKKWLLERGISRIEIRVASKNLSALSFWERQGFKERLKIMFRDL